MGQRRRPIRSLQQALLQEQGLLAEEGEGGGAGVDTDGTRREGALSMRLSRGGRARSSSSSSSRRAGTYLLPASAIAVVL